MEPAVDLVRRSAERDPRAPALVDAASGSSGGTRRWSYGELDGWVEEVCGRLASRGVGEGRRVGVRLAPGPEAVVLFHACVRMGAVFVPFHPDWTDAEVAACLVSTGPVATMVETPGEVAGHPPASECGQPRGAHPPGAPRHDPDHIAALILTSGSTGSPRPVPIAHGNLEASARASRERLGLGSGDRWLTSLSMSHVGGLALVHRAAWLGCALVTITRFDASEVASLVDSGEVSHLSLVPVMLARLLDRRGTRPAPDSLRLLLIGGAATPAPLLERALRLGYPIGLTYGLTEASSQVATAAPPLVRRKPGTVGAPLAGTSVRVADPDPEGRGEILVKGPTVVAAVVHTSADPADAADARDAAEAAGESARRGPSSVRRSNPPVGDGASSVHLDPGGWLHTGDVGRLDDEGHLWVTGRRSDRIVTGGVTIEPAEVEAALLLHPAVAEVAVIGVPDEEWGERVVAVVVPDPSDRAPTLDELLEFCRERLASPKRPRGLRIVEALPRNANGKIDRAALARG